MQAGLYRRAYRALKGDRLPDFRFVVQEVNPPYAVAQFAFDAAELAYADLLAHHAVRQWGQCLAADSWPSYPAGVNVMEAPYWIRERLEEGG